jgi:hypothetical protein
LQDQPKNFNYEMPEPEIIVVRNFELLKLENSEVRPSGTPILAG